MPDRYTLERIENWVADFVQGERSRGFSGGAREYAGEILTTLLAGACDERGLDPGEVEEADLRAALLGKVAALALPASVQRVVPDLACAFLASLEEEGRLAGGRSLGLFVRALRPAFGAGSGAGGKGRTERRPGPKLSPNEPCPCGSGRKFKKCCQI